MKKRFVMIFSAVMVAALCLISASALADDGLPLPDTFLPIGGMGSTGTWKIFVVESDSFESYSDPSLGDNDDGLPLPDNFLPIGGMGSTGTWKTFVVESH